MLRPLDPSESPAPLAYRVPWYVDRTDDAHPRVFNASDEPVEFVRLHLTDPACSLGPLIGRLDPGESIELCLCAEDLDAVTVSVSWFRHGSDEEYAWRFVL